MALSIKDPYRFSDIDQVGQPVTLSNQAYTYRVATFDVLGAVVIDKSLLYPGRNPTSNFLALFEYRHGIACIA